ncbi:2'-5' RNA ligase family protein [Actinosynnema sp. NPDC020468]|uniref:2'-5' RNA ligase family protein n=1 Tax=Actinosynnema sp. NPDC020468 TaxID=3154488 RepID=UPI0033EA6664
MNEAEPMRDHWWWRPGWKVGRSFYTWHITFADHPDVLRLVADYEPVLAALPRLDSVPARWLHLTLQGVGFTDEVARHDVDRIVDAARTRCAELAPFTITIGPAHLDPETVQMPARPLEPLAGLRAAIRSAIGDVWGHDNVPEAETGFRAHVSLAYSNRAGSARDVARTLTGHAEHSAHTTVSSVALIDLNRDQRAYEWIDVATVALGSAS